MKVFSLTFFLLIGFLLGHAQTVRPYWAVVKAKSGKLKGILYKVDSTSIILHVNDGFVATKIANIQSVKIRRTKKGYKVKNYLGKMPETTYTLDQNGKLVDKWGHKAPSLGDEALAAGYGAFLNGLINVVAFPIHAINPNLANFNLAKQKDEGQLEQLSYYSITYQSNPNSRLADLKKLKEVAARAKQ